jgi:serine phosphatase RsbU (regulator of sigma subunit)
MAETEIRKLRLDLNSLLDNLASIFWPELRSMSEQRRRIGTGDVLTFLYSLPLALAGLAWLISVTDLGLLRQNAAVFILNLGLYILFSKITYFIIIELRTDRYGSADGSLANMILWSSIFLLGATAIWIALIWLWFDFVRRLRQSRSLAARWGLLRNLSTDQASFTFAGLLSLTVYARLGGEFPVPTLSLATIRPAFAALSVQILLIAAIWAGYIAYHIKIQQKLASPESTQLILKFFGIIFGLQFLANPFAILAAGLYVQNGILVYIFFLTGLLLVAMMARSLSWSVESSRQQSRQLQKLEQLGRAIIDAPPDATELAQILEDHVPDMFPSGRFAIWISPDNLLFKHPEDWPSAPVEVWNYLLGEGRPQAYTAKDELPWKSAAQEHNAIVTAPIHNVDSGRTIGGIYLELRTLAQSWDQRALKNLFPAVQSLAAQIASARHQAEIYQQTLAYQKVSQELQLAGKIQASFLPDAFPVIPGWQLAVTLLPARETSGDFFDVIQLGEGRLGILIADVADKGVGPALYMAIGRTLMRTYAVEYDAEPEVAFYATNQRLLKDARANLFVTAFYGILETETGRLTYSNAGHNPPYLIKNTDGAIQSLDPSGMPLGIEEQATWSQDVVQIDPGDTLILFTDGIPDAQNEMGEFFDDESLLEVCLDSYGRPAHEMQAAILAEIENFVGDAPQFDDITLMILERDN